MATSDQIQITVLIAGRPYPLQIKASDEPVIRQIAKEVNEKVQAMQQAYPNRDKQDCLALAILGVAAELHEAKKQLDQPEDLPERLEKLNSLLDGLL
ncbi:MAG TPA: cell division protein ZapA [Phaeodactylibacter sp.]|nr:cell division protein ZapA [Phaeodactylibacter sp.]